MNFDIFNIIVVNYVDLERNSIGINSMFKLAKWNYNKYDFQILKNSKIKLKVPQKHKFWTLKTPNAKCKI